MSTHSIFPTLLLCTGLLACTTTNPDFCKESRDCPAEQGCVRNTCGTAAVLSLEALPIRTFRFTWTQVPTATHYKLLAMSETGSEFVQVGEDIEMGERSVEILASLHTQLGTQYVLQSCDETGCTDSEPLAVEGNLENAIGYFKKRHVTSTEFGTSVALSANGKTLAVGMPNDDAGLGVVYLFTENESSWQAGMDLEGSAGDDFGHSIALSANGNVLAIGVPRKEGGTVYVFTYDTLSWQPQAILTASNADTDDGFGESLALSGDGTTLVVGAPGEDSNALGVGGSFAEQSDNSEQDAGAAYVFTNATGSWAQESYVKPSNTGMGDRFGHAVALSQDGEAFATGAPGQAPSGAGYMFRRAGDSWSQEGYLKDRDANPSPDALFGTSLALSSDGNRLAVGAPMKNQGVGAVHLFAHTTQWIQEAVLEPSNGNPGQQFGQSVSLTGSGEMLAIGAHGESSAELGVANEIDGSLTAPASGAVYLFAQDNDSGWSQRSYIKASNTGAEDGFGFSTALSTDGNTLAVGAPGEDSGAIGVGGDQSDNSAPDSGAVYLY